MAPGHGTDDYEVCKKLNLSIHSPVDDFGKFTSEVCEPSFEGKFVLTDGTAAVIDYLKDNNILIKEEKIIHKYPYDWRTKKPIINRFILKFGLLASLFIKNVIKYEYIHILLLF